MSKHTRIATVAALLACIAVSMLPADEVEDAKKKAVDLINRGIAQIARVGKDAALKQFTDKNGGFVDGEFYIFAVNLNGLTLAHGGNPGLVGQSMLELKDADGIFFIKEFIKAVKEKGAAWVDYKWSNPTTKRVEQKSTYVKRVGNADYFLGCGIYLKR